MRIEIIEEHANCWDGDWNTLKLYSNPALMRANSHEIIKKEISDLEDDIKFLNQILKVDYTASWMQYNNDVMKFRQLNPFEEYVNPYPVEEQKHETEYLDENEGTPEVALSKEDQIKAEGKYPLEMYNLDELEQSATSIWNGLKKGKGIDQIKTNRKYLVEQLKQIDTEVISKNYTYNDIDFYDIYKQKADVILGCIQKIMKLEKKQKQQKR